MLTTTQMWYAVAVILVTLCYLYTEEVSALLDWLILQCSSISIEIRLTLWKAWIYPGLRFNVWKMKHRARARLRKYDKIAQQTKQPTRKNNAHDRQV
jgi:hypothetical protein